jgi:hypothetical protein
LPHAGNNLTAKERSYLQDALQMENLCIAKCNVYADQSQNQALRSIVYELSRNKRNHANQLKRMLGQSVNSPAGQQFQ